MFDKILVDAPCSGEGMFKSNADVKKSYNEGSNIYYSETQKNILPCARKMLASGGEIIYSTCTFSPIENEYVIKDFLGKNQDFELVKIGHSALGVSEGIDIGGGQMLNCARVWPHKAKGEGHFAAKLRHLGKKNTSRRENIKTKSPKNIGNYLEFAQNYFIDVSFDNIYCVDNKIYSICGLAPDFSGLRVLRGDFCLGEIKTKRFEPSQALAMALQKSQFKNTIELNSQEAPRYLSGESFEADANAGFNLVCYKGYPLGFGKVIDGRLKNKYMKGWRVNLG
jgi:NOL1/NOP2/fmu family ribosome biogenesis protein